MKWLKREELIKRDKAATEYFMTLSDTRVTKISVSKGVRDIIKEKGHTNMDIGFDEEQNIMMIRLNKRSDGLALLSANNSIRAQISAGNLVEVAKDAGIQLPTKQRLTLELTDAKGGDVFEVKHQVTSEE